MKFVISSSILSAHLSVLGRVIQQKNSIPILNCFRFNIEAGTLGITASDNDSTLTARLDLVESEQDICFAVNAKTLQDAIKELPDQPLDFYLNTDTFELVIEYQNGQYRLMAQNADDYPLPARSEGEEISIEVNSDCMLSSISRSLVTAANDPMRPQLNGACFDITEGSLSLVSTDQTHLSITKIGLNGNIGAGTFILNTRPATLLRSILPKDSLPVTMTFSQRGATFVCGEYSLQCSLVTERYPNYHTVFPKDNPYVVTVNRAGLISVLRRVLVFANPQASNVKIRIENGSMNITSQDMDFGKSAEENILCDAQDVHMHIAFKGNKLLDLVQSLEAEDVTFHLSDPSRAAVIIPAEQKENEEVEMLIMPSIYRD